MIRNAATAVVEYEGGGFRIVKEFFQPIGIAPRPTNLLCAISDLRRLYHSTHGIRTMGGGEEPTTRLGGFKAGITLSNTCIICT